MNGRKFLQPRNIRFFVPLLFIVYAIVLSWVVPSVSWSGLNEDLAAGAAVAGAAVLALMAGLMFWMSSRHWFGLVLGALFGAVLGGYSGALLVADDSPLTFFMVLVLLVFCGVLGVPLTKQTILERRRRNQQLRISMPARLILEEADELKTSDNSPRSRAPSNRFSFSIAGLFPLFALAAVLAAMASSSWGRYTFDGQFRPQRSFFFRTTPSPPPGVSWVDPGVFAAAVVVSAVAGAVVGAVCGAGQSGGRAMLIALGLVSGAITGAAIGALLACPPDFAVQVGGSAAILVTGVIVRSFSS